MARDRDELERLRREALRATQRAGRKLARLRRERNVQETGGIDPRVPRDRIGRMNRIQLRAYLNRAESFIDRRTQFVGTSRGAPIPKATFDAYKRAERAVNKQREEFLKQISKTPSPTGRGTVGDFISRFGSDRSERRMLTNSPVKPINRKSTDFTTEKGLRKITEDLLKQSLPEFREKQIQEWREQTVEMLKRAGNKELANKAMTLSDKQFATMWTGTGFVNSVVSFYELMKSANAGDKKAFGMDVGELGEVLDWASRL